MTQNAKKALLYKKMVGAMEVSVAKNPDDSYYSRQDLKHYKELLKEALEPVPYEVVAGECLPDIYEREKADVWTAVDTLENATSIHQAASCDRMNLITEAGNPELCLDAADSIEAKNSFEKMMAHQLATCHAVGMKLVAKAGETKNEIVALKTLSIATKFMEVFQKGFETIHKVKRGNQQTVVVKYQQVNVTEGGQAVIANATGGCMEKTGRECCKK